jgi:urease accessory protein
MPVTDTGMTTDGTSISDPALYRLMTWLSPGFPVGGYTYSHGIEYAVEAGLVGDRESLGRWIAGILLYGSGRVDGVFVGAAWSAVVADDADALSRVTEIAEVFRGSAETAVESLAQGKAFIDAVRGAWPHPRLDGWVRTLEDMDRAPSYPVAVGVAAALAGVPRRPAVSGYLHGIAANLVSAGVRLVPLGQSDGLRTIAALEESVEAAADRALDGDLDDLGTATFMVDWTSMQHETQYTRLFRS